VGEPFVDVEGPRLAPPVDRAELGRLRQSAENRRSIEAHEKMIAFEMHPVVRSCSAYLAPRRTEI
jgi:hypothetical protein